MSTRRLTVGQALVEFLAHQWTVDGELRERTIPSILGIFGHGNVAGLGQALKQYNVNAPTLLPYHQARNEQAMVHQAVGFARIHRRRATLAATASVGPGAANMLTGAALATANRMPVLLLPSDTFATRVADPVLQALEHPHDTGIQVTDAFRPLSRFFDRVQRPEQLYSIALAAMRVLTDPADTGAVTIALPEDVQAEAIDVPAEFLVEREWHIRRPPPERWALDAAAAAIQAARKPFLVAGGGVIYSGAEDALRGLVELTGIPVGTTQAGGGVLNWDHPQYLGGVGATGTAAANRLAAEADLVIGVGTRYSDFTTASRTAFQNPDVKFLNVNVAAFDAYKHGTRLPVVADARETLRCAHGAPARTSNRGRRTPSGSIASAASGTRWSTSRSARLDPSCQDSPRSSARSRRRATLGTCWCGRRLPPRGSPQAVARARRARISRRVRVLRDGLRDRRRDRRQARPGRAGRRPRRDRDGRRRLLPDAALRTRDRRRRGHQGHHRADPERGLSPRSGVSPRASAPSGSALATDT